MLMENQNIPDRRPSDPGYVAPLDTEPQRYTDSYELIAKGRVAAHLLDQYTFHLDMCERYARDGDDHLAGVASVTASYYHALWEVAQDGLVELRTRLGYK